MSECERMLSENKAISVSCAAAAAAADAYQFVGSVIVYAHTLYTPSAFRIQHP